LFASHASAATYYVSKTATNGYAIGNDSNNGTSKSTPFLSIFKAYSVTVTNQDTIYVNDGAYDGAEGVGNVEGFFRLEKGITLLPENAGQVTLTAASGAGLVIYAKLLASASTTIGAFNIDAGGVGYANGSVYYNPQGAGASLTLNGTSLINQSSYGIYNAYTGNAYNFYAQNISITGTNVSAHAIYLSGIIGGTIDINGLNLNWTGNTASSIYGIYVNAGATYPAISVKNITGLVQNSGGVYGVVARNIPNALVENSNITVTSSSLTASSNGILIYADTGKSADGGVIRNNHVTCSFKGGIAL
jgi:hypothetical protein